MTKVAERGRVRQRKRVELGRRSISVGNTRAPYELPTAAYPPCIVGTGILLIDRELELQHLNLLSFPPWEAIGSPLFAIFW